MKQLNDQNCHPSSVVIGLDCLFWPNGSEPITADLLFSLCLASKVGIWSCLAEGRNEEGKRCLTQVATGQSVIEGEGLSA